MVSYDTLNLNFSFPSFSSVIKVSSWLFFNGSVCIWCSVLMTTFLLNSPILKKSLVFESFINVQLSMLIFSFIKNGSSQIFEFFACGNLGLVCILITFASRDRNMILSGAYKTKTVLFLLIVFVFLTCFLAEKLIDLVRSIVTKEGIWSIFYVFNDLMTKKI